jgi:hypothetical protein
MSINKNNKIFLHDFKAILFVTRINHFWNYQNGYDNAGYYI